MEEKTAKEIMEDLTEALRTELKLKESRLASYMGGTFPNDPDMQAICAKVFTGESAKYNPCGKSWEFSPAGMMSFITAITNLKTAIAQCEAAIAEV